MKAALRLLLAPYRFSVDRLFRMGQIGWAHWFDDPNTLYRRRNRLTYTRDVGNSVWNLASGATVTSDSTTAPDGTVTADTITFTTTGYRYQTYAHGSSLQGQTLTFSCWVWSPSKATIGLRIAGHVTGSDTAFTGPVALTGSAVRLSVTRTFTSTDTSVIAGLDNRTAGGYGDGIAGDVYVWGAQLEFASTATEYQDVPTTWEQAYLDAVGAERIFAWQDSAGTTPVTAVGQSIGLTLDRAYGGARGAELFPSLNFSTGVVTGSVTGTTANTFTTSGAGGLRFAGLVSVGKMYDVRITGTVSAGTFYFRNPSNLTNSASGTGTFTINARLVWSTTAEVYFQNDSAATTTITSISVREIPGTHLIQATGTARPTLSARVNALLNTATMSTQNVTTIAASYKLSFTGTGTVTLSGTSTAGPLVGTGANDRVSLTFTPTAGTLTLTVSGSVTLADLRTADDAAKNIPAYQRVGATAADHDTDGFPHGQYPDGTDDNQTTTTGGGGTAGFFYCGAITVSGGAGTARTIWSDTGTNTGYRVRINASNKLELAAGNGTAYTTVQSNETVTAPGTYLLSAWDDGGVLAVQVNNFAAATTTRPTVSAGTTAITVYKDNGAASSYFNGRDYGSVYAQRYIGESQHARLKRWLADRARITL